MLKLKYWCKTEEEKEVLLNILNENEKKQQKEISEKYNPDNLFKNKSEQNIFCTQVFHKKILYINIG